MITKLPDATVSTSSTPIEGSPVSFVSSTLELSPAYRKPIIPDDELWLYRDKKILERVARGLAQAAEGRGRVLSFARYSNEEE